GHASFRGAGPAGPDGGGDWTTAQDYGNGVKRKGYHDYWYEDAPQFYVQSPAGTHEPGSHETFWWQAHVYIEEVPRIENWWGYAATAQWGRISAGTPFQPDWVPGTPSLISRVKWKDERRQWF